MAYKKTAPRKTKKSGRRYRMYKPVTFKKGRKTVTRIVRRELKKTLEPKILDQQWLYDPAVSSWQYGFGGATSFAVPIDPYFASDNTGGATKWFRQSWGQISGIAWLSTAPAVNNWTNPILFDPVDMISGSKFKRTGFQIKLLAYGQNYNVQSGAAPYPIQPFVQFSTANSYEKAYPTVATSLFFRVRVIRAMKGVSDENMLSAIQNFTPGVTNFRPPHTYNTLFDRTYQLVNGGIKVINIKMSGKRGSQRFQVPVNTNSTYNSFQTDNNVFLFISFSTTSETGFALTNAQAQIPNFNIRIRNYYMDD